MSGSPGVQRDEALEELVVLQDEHKATLRARAFSDRLVAQLAEERNELVDIKADLTAEVSSLRKELAMHAQQDVNRVRSEARDKREQLRAARSLQEPGRVQGLLEAEEKVAAAQKRAIETEARAMQAEADADARAKAEQTRPETAIMEVVEELVQAAQKRLTEAEASLAQAKRKEG